MSVPVPLRKLIRIHYGKALKAEHRQSDGCWAVYGSSGQVGLHSETLTEDATIIIGRKGSVGEITYAPNGGWTIDTAFYVEILDKSKIDLRYLYYSLKKLNLQKHTITTSIPGISREKIYDSCIPVPPLPEQKRIAAILDKADAIRRKREKAIELTDSFLRSVFLEMFWLNPERKNWKEKAIQEMVQNGKGSMRTGPFGSALRHDQFIESGIAVLGIDNAVKNRFTWGERRFISREKYEEMKRYTVYPGDVIITIMGTTGRSAVVPSDIPLAISTKHLATLTLDRELAEPEFLAFAIHSHPSFLQQIKNANRGAIMDGLNLGIIKNLSLNLPPIDLQQRFTKLVVATRRLRDRQVNDFLNSGMSNLRASLEGILFCYATKETPSIAPSAGTRIQEVHAL